MIKVIYKIDKVVIEMSNEDYEVIGIDLIHLLQDVFNRLGKRSDKK